MNEYVQRAVDESFRLWREFADANSEYTLPPEKEIIEKTIERVPPTLRNETDVRKLMTAIATGEWKHRFDNYCPDEINGWGSRDNECPACQVLIAYEQENGR